MPDETKPETEIVTLYFPDIETGSASVGYCNITIVDHRAEVPAHEAIAIKHWLDGGQAMRLEDINPFAEPTPTEPIAIGMAHGARVVRGKREEGQG